MDSSEIASITVLISYPALDSVVIDGFSPSMGIGYINDFDLSAGNLLVTFQLGLEINQIHQTAWAMGSTRSNLQSDHRPCWPEHELRVAIVGLDTGNLRAILKSRL
jgi:hypothetical protein